MTYVTSKDNTKIVYDKLGNGSALILVGGAFQDRRGLAAHAALLSKDFTVYNYDRRGRGESSDTQPYAVAREVEDIEALIQAAGGKAFLFGGSSGAALALEAAKQGLAITKLAIYEPPFVVDDTRPPVPADIARQLRDLIKAGKPGDAAELFLVRGANMPPEVVQEMRAAPYWPEAEGAALTLPYDADIMGDTMSGKPLPTKRWQALTIPTLVMGGGQSPAWQQNSLQQLVSILPNATQVTITDQAHDVAAEALAPKLAEFFL
jgi:pimeloyl-ACP methyl ester carboxylesterase